MPSLEEVLKKNNAKIKRIEVARPSLSIATEDRPYSITESKSFQPIFDQTSSELKNVFNADIGGMVNPLVTFARSENNENSIKETDNKVAETRQQSGNGSEEKALAMREHSVSKTNSIALATPLASASSSSSVLNIKETTTELDNEWNFDITPYSKFGFMTSQLKQLASLGVISAMEVAQSLIEFNHDLDNNALPQKMNTGKLNFLMGILRKGQSYVSEGYKNEEEAIISEMARRAEDKRKKLIEDKFVAWEASLSDEERKKIEDKIPLNLRVLFRVHGLSNLEVKNWLFNYYLQACIT